MIIDFDDYDGYYITSMIADKLPNLMDCITIKTRCKQISDKVIHIEKEYDTIRNCVRAFVRIDYIIPK